MEDKVSAAKAEFTRANQRILKALETTPDDKITWSPSSTCRTPCQQVAHSALAIEGIHGMLTGKPFPFASTAELDSTLREQEKAYTTREQAKALLEANSQAYLAWLDSLTPAQLAATIELPFGTFPMADAITFPADHTRGHAAQLEYTQTIWGDHDWHM